MKDSKLSHMNTSIAETKKRDYDLMVNEMNTRMKMK